MLLFRPVPLYQKVGRLRSLRCVAAEGARRRLLVLGIAWKWQAAIHGGLPKPLERRLAALGAGLRSGAVDGAASARTAIRRPLGHVGDRLVQVRKGERHDVQVTDTGYLWRAGIVVRHRRRDHRQPPQWPGLLRPARGGRSISDVRTGRNTVRCAIYTRKSTEEGLEQDFNSLDAQREACAAYTLEGWTSRSSTLPGSASSRSPRPFKNTTSMGRLALNALVPFARREGAAVGDVSRSLQLTFWP